MAVRGRRLDGASRPRPLDGCPSRTISEALAKRLRAQAGNAEPQTPKS